jgi:hypothetical protein
MFYTVAKGTTHEETIRAIEDQFGDQKLAAGCCNQPRTRTQDNGESLQEFDSAIEQLTRCAFPALHEDHVHRGPGKAFSSSIRDQGIKPQLLLGGKRTLNIAFKQTLELAIIGFSIRRWKTSDRALWRSQPSPKRKTRLLTAYVPAL